MQAGALRPSTFVDVNLLPEELRSKSRSGWYLAALLALAVALPLLAPLYRAQDVSWSQAAALEATWSATERELAATQADFVAAQDLRQELAATNATLSALEVERSAILGDLDTGAEVAAAVDRLPVGVRLLTVEGDALGVRITAEASRAEDAFAYARRLAEERSIGTATVTSIERAGDSVRFTIDAGR